MTIETVFGERLRQLRDIRWMTQAQLSLDCGVPLGRLHLIEKGGCEPTIAELLRLADGLGMTPGNLLPRDHPKTARVCDHCGGHGVVWEKCDLGGILRDRDRGIDERVES